MERRGRGKPQSLPDATLESVWRPPCHLGPFSQGDGGGEEVQGLTSSPALDLGGRALGTCSPQTAGRGQHSW